jgi:acetolactate synthase-1/3 small subunit
MESRHDRARLSDIDHEQEDIMSTALAAAVTVPEGNPLHTISVLVRNQPGVLVRVALVFARRGYNIESLVVSPDPTDAGFSRMTITCRGAADTLEQMIRQVAKLVDVVRAIDHTGQSVVETEIALIKLQAEVSERTEILQIAEHYKAKVVDCGTGSLILRVTGGSEKLDSFISLLRPFGLVELVRSGKILMTRGPEAT